MPVRQPRAAGVPRRDFIAKEATRSVAASILAIKSLRSRNDVEMLDVARTLIELGARPKLIIELTGLPQSALRALHGRESPREIGMGRVPESVGVLMSQVRPHLESTVFYQGYLQILLAAEQEQSGSVDGRLFARALLFLRGAIPDCKLAPAHFFLVARNHHQRLLDIKECATCRCNYLSTTINVMIDGKQGKGSCPMCRYLQGKLGQRVKLMQTDAKSARLSMRKLLDPEDDPVEAG